MFKVLLFSFLLSFSSFAGEVYGVTMPETMKVGNENLMLNGMGTRKATWLRVKVYVGGLYVKEKSTNSAKILDQGNPKVIDMNFVRDVEAEKLRGGWSDAWKAAVPQSQRTKLQAHFDKFNAAMGDIQKNQKIIVSFTDKGINVKFNGSDKGTFGNKDFSRALLSIWFINAADEGLRDGLLGV
ncbi:chalcone isomerase family protein [Bacteriovoracaceae bacterium]|nr:chalcone isomerase family protein [Bacteriovoracaceae bacterium]